MGGLLAGGGGAGVRLFRELKTYGSRGQDEVTPRSVTCQALGSLSFLRKQLRESLVS